jgi:hypothetical protein
MLSFSSDFSSMARSVSAFGFCWLPQVATVNLRVASLSWDRTTILSSHDGSFNSFHHY